MLTYNHEKFIAKAIDHVLSQNVDFTYELIIGEDCSTDRTREICIDYQKKYPQLIKLILHPVNQGLIKNYVSLMQSAVGKYIAVCAGDDYWCDDLKLQKQVNLMEVHPECTMCFTNAYEEYDDMQNGKQRDVFSNIENKEYDFDDVYKATIPASSVLFKNHLLDFTFLLKRAYYAEDVVMQLKLAELGPAMGISDITMAYVRHKGAIMNLLCTDREKKFKNSVSYSLMMNEEFEGRYQSMFYVRISELYYLYAKGEYKRGFRLSSLKYLFFAMKYDLVNTIKLLGRSIIK
ncbi:MAG: glycosyltransferase [Prevotellaceae bacterium]|nr:glycosyltransferase [Candidatus Colivivens equi]